MAHLPNFSGYRLLVPLRAAPLRYALTHLMRGSRSRRLLSAGLRCPGSAALLAHFLPGAGFTVHRRGARPPSDWMSRHLPDGGNAGAILRRSWVGERGSVLLYLFDRKDAPEPRAFAKLACSEVSRASVEREQRALALLGAGAFTAGMCVPSAQLSQHGCCSLLMQSVVPGVPATQLLASGAMSFEQALETVGTWLERWGSLTRTVRPLQPGDLEREVLDPARQLADVLGPPYLAWLRHCCREATGSTVPLAAAHQDLNMTNLLVASDGRLGLVDWERACAEAFPLQDLWFAAVQAAAASRRCSVEEAFEACFGSTPAPALKRWSERLARTLGVGNGFAQLCFHACWLHHARMAFQWHGVKAGGFLRVAAAISKEPERIRW